MERRASTQFVGCYRTTRRCYHCGFEMEYVVLDGEEITKPSVTDFCAGVDFHLKSVKNDMPPIMQDSFFYGDSKEVRITWSILKGAKP